jgi:hypothetical protein
VSSTTHQANFLASLSTTYSHVIVAPAANFLAPLPGRKKKTSARGVFAHTSFTLLLLCFTLFYFTCIVLYQKPKKKIRILGSCYFFTLVYYV